MKKLAGTLLSLLISGSAFALPIGNPWEASLMRDGIFWEGNGAPCWNLCNAWSVRLGFYGDYVFHQDMENIAQKGHPHLHDFEFYTNAGYLALNLWDRIDLFGTLGATRASIQTNLSAVGGTSNRRLFLESDTSFSWSIGGRATIWEYGCFGIGAEGQYFRSLLNRNFTKIENEAPIYADGVETTFREWQFGFGGAYRINISSCLTALIPYAGVKWSRTRLTPNIGGEIRSSCYFGFAVGATLLGCNKGSITVEGRFLNQKAVYVNGQVRF